MTRPAPRLLPYQVVFGVNAGLLGGIIAVLGELRDELGVSDSTVGAIVMAGFLAAFVAQIAFAPYADRGHGRRMAIAGVALSAAALFVMVVADTAAAWIGARALLGFAGGLLVPAIRRAATVLDPARAGENLGRLIIGEIAGFVVGPLAAGVLAEVGGIRLPFLVFGAGLVLFLPIAARLPDDPGRRTTEVMSSIDLLGIRRLQGALLLMFGYVFLIGAFEAVIPVMFQDRGGGPIETGIAFVLFGLPIAFVSPSAGRTADRHGGARVAAIGMATAAALSMVYGLVPGIWPVVGVMVVGGMADGFGFTAGQVAVSRAVPEERQAGALGLMGAAEVLGAGVAALPAAAVYGAAGAGAAWLAVGAASLLVVLAGHLRIRGTEPFRPAGEAP